MDHDAKLSTVATGFGFTEGPVWDPTGFLYVSDEEINKIFRVYVADGRKEEVISLGDPDGNTSAGLCERFARHHPGRAGWQIQDPGRPLPRETLQ